MLSGGFGDVTQSLPAFSDLSSPSGAVVSTTVTSISTSTPVIQQAPFTRRVAATSGKQFHATANPLSTAYGSHFGSVPVSRTIEPDSRVGREADSSSVPRSSAFGTNGTSNRTDMVIDEKEMVSSRRGRLAPEVGIIIS